MRVRTFNSIGIWKTRIIVSLKEGPPDIIQEFCPIVRFSDSSLPLDLFLFFSRRLGSRWFEQIYWSPFKRVNLKSLDTSGIDFTKSSEQRKASSVSRNDLCLKSFSLVAVH